MERRIFMAKVVHIVLLLYTLYYLKGLKKELAKISLKWVSFLKSLHWTFENTSIFYRETGKGPKAGISIMEQLPPRWRRGRWAGSAPACPSRCTRSSALSRSRSDGNSTRSARTCAGCGPACSRWSRTPSLAHWILDRILQEIPHLHITARHAY